MLKFFIRSFGGIFNFEKLLLWGAIDPNVLLNAIQRASKLTNNIVKDVKNL